MNDEFNAYINDLDIDHDEYKALTAYMNEATEQIKVLVAEREAWQHRAEVAERDINTMLRAHVDEMHCDQCAHGEHREECRYYGKDMCLDAEWRGSCAENGGEV